MTQPAVTKTTGSCAEAGPGKGAGKTAGRKAAESLGHSLLVGLRMVRDIPRFSQPRSDLKQSANTYRWQDYAQAAARSSHPSPE